MIKRLFKTMVAVLAIAAAATGPARAQSHQKYTSAVALTDLQVGDTLCKGASVTDCSHFYINGGWCKLSGEFQPSGWNVPFGLNGSVGENGLLNFLNAYYFTPANDQGADGYGWVVTAINDGTVYLSGVTSTLSGLGSEQSPFLISSQADWNYLASLVDLGMTGSGMFFRMTNDITVTTMVGTSANGFAGTFDGYGHTLTVNYNTTGDNAAPFRYTDNATFRNLHVAGNIVTTMRYAGSFISGCYGTTTFYNCRSSVHMSTGCTAHNDITCGGFVGVAQGPTTMTGCLFDGSMTNTDNDINCGGFVGWDAGGTTFTDCLFAPTQITEGLLQKTFARNTISTFNNSYYTQAYGDAQGLQARTIDGGDDVTVAVAGNTTTYNVSGITSYGTGIKYGNVLYGGNGDAVSLNLTYSGSGLLDTYSADNGTLSGSANPYTLTMADANTVITANTIPLHTVRMAAGTEDAANWTLASGDASVTGDQVLENVMSGSQVTATYNGTTKKVKSVKAVKYVAPAATVATAPTATGAIIEAGSTTALVSGGVASGGTMMYAVTATNAQPASTADFSASVPTAEGRAAGTYYVWYYAKADANHSDSEIAGPVSVTVTSTTITVTWNHNDITGSGHSFTKDGVTITAGMIDFMDKNFMQGGTFTTTLGNFTKIEVTAGDVGMLSGTGWSGNNQKKTWTGNASSVSFSGDIMGMGGMMGPTQFVFTIE